MIKLDAGTTPVPDADSKPYYEYTKKHELRAQRCKACGSMRHPPGIMCPQCQSQDIEWRKLSGRGAIYSWEVIHHRIIPAFMEGPPYTVVLVEPEEQPGLRFLGNLLDCPREQLRIGLPVEAVFEDHTPEVTLVQWRPRKGD